METGRFILVPPKYDESMGEGEEKVCIPFRLKRVAYRMGQKRKTIWHEG